MQPLVHPDEPTTRGGAVGSPAHPKKDEAAAGDGAPDDAASDAMVWWLGGATSRLPQPRVSRAPMVAGCRPEGAREGTMPVYFFMTHRSGFIARRGRAARGADLLPRRRPPAARWARGLEKLQGQTRWPNASQQTSQQGTAALRAGLAAAVPAAAPAALADDAPAQPACWRTSGSARSRWPGTVTAASSSSRGGGDRTTRPSHCNERGLRPRSRSRGCCGVRVSRPGGARAFAQHAARSRSRPGARPARYAGWRWMLTDTSARGRRPSPQPCLRGPTRTPSAASHSRPADPSSK